MQLNDESLAAMGQKKAGLSEVLDPDTIMCLGLVKNKKTFFFCVKCKWESMILIFQLLEKREDGLVDA